MNKLTYESKETLGTCSLKDDVLEGISEFFTRDGKLLSRTGFKEGVCQGLSEMWYPDGQLKSKEMYLDGELDGDQEYYYPDGTLRAMIPYKRGKLNGWVKLFWEDGRQKRLSFYREHARHGRERIWNVAGVLVDDGVYYFGAPLGLHRHWYDDGTLRCFQFYYTDKKVDIRAYNQKGELIFESIYTDDKHVRETHWLDGNEIKKETIKQ